MTLAKPKSKPSRKPTDHWAVIREDCLPELCESRAAAMRFRDSVRVNGDRIVRVRVTEIVPKRKVKR